MNKPRPNGRLATLATRAFNLLGLLALPTVLAMVSTLKSTADLKDDVRNLSTQALAVLDDDKKTTAEKVAETEKLDADIKSALAELKDAEAVDERRKLFTDLSDTKAAPGQRAEDEPVEKRSIGHQFVESAQYKGLVAGGDLKAGQWNSGSVELKATMTESASTGILPQLQPGLLPILFKQLRIAALMPVIPISSNSNSIRYLKETTATNAADIVAEGATKPASTLIFAPVDEVLRKIATTIKVTDEMLQDYAFVRGYIDGRLMLFVEIKEEDQLLNGDGTGNNLTGLMNRSGLTTAVAKGSDTRAVAIYKQITAIRATAFIEPDGIAVHPTDWQSARTETDANGQFFGGGPFTGAYGNTGAPGIGAPFDATPYWGLRPIITPSIAQGTALVGAYATCAAVLRKGGLSVEATNSNEDDFKNNLVAIRAEERVGLAVFRPAGFGKVTGL